MIDLFQIKRVNKTQYLRDNYGGDWKYDGQCAWNCDDGKRTVVRTASCSHDGGCSCSPTYWMYGDGIPHYILFI